jgi:putative tryptophan/tyrosine transport system substrate-binding protein
MVIGIGRRQFVSVLGGMSVAWPLMAHAQPAGKVWGIGFLTVQSAAAYSSLNNGFIQGMRDLGYVEGVDFVCEWRTSDGQYDRLPALAADLVQQRFDILASGVAAAVHALQESTRSIPIAMVGLADPIGLGFIPSLARPGGNITGTASSSDETTPKQIELLAQFVSRPSRVGVLTNPEGSTTPLIMKAAEAASRKAGLVVLPMSARNAKEIDAAFAGAVASGIQMVMIATDAIFSEERARLAALALKFRLPSISPERQFPVAGGLMSYGEDRSEFYRHTAFFVDRIMKGAKPADLPIEQPARFHLVIIQKTADAMGVTIPPALHIFADEVIE